MHVKNIQSGNDGIAIDALIVILRGTGQIILQENAISGLVLLAGILLADFVAGIAVLAAVMCGTLTAQMLNYDKSNIAKGLYGFNAALVGAAFFFFFEPDAVLWVTMLIFSVLATVVYHAFLKRNIPIFTFPFIVISWLALGFPHMDLPFVVRNTSSELSSITPDVLYAVRGFGQVVFQDEILPGIFVLVALIIGSRVKAIYAFAVAIIAGLIAFLAGADTLLVNSGLFGFNPILCAIVFAGPKRSDAAKVIVSMLISTALSMLMVKAGLVQLTFPFVASCWICLGLWRNQR